MAGVDVELERRPGVTHVFRIAPFLPESTLPIDNIARFVRARTGWRDLARRDSPARGVTRAGDPIRAGCR